MAFRPVATLLPGDDPRHGLQGDHVAVRPEPGYLADTHVGDHVLAPPVLAPMYVRDVALNRGDFARQDGVADSNAVVSEATWVEDDGGELDSFECSCFLTLAPVDGSTQAGRIEESSGDGHRVQPPPPP